MCVRVRSPGPLPAKYQNQYLQSFSTTYNHSNGFSSAIVSGRFPVHTMTFARLAVTIVNPFLIYFPHVFFLNFIPDHNF